MWWCKKDFYPTHCNAFILDRADYYVGNFRTLGNYASPSNDDLFHLADDVERLPNQRVKVPVGMRLNYYLNEYLVLRTYYRNYRDNWGIDSNTPAVWTTGSFEPRLEVDTHLQILQSNSSQLL